MEDFMFFVAIIFSLLIILFLVFGLIIFIKKSAIEIKHLRLDYERDKKRFNS